MKNLLLAVLMSVACSAAAENAWNEFHFLDPESLIKAEDVQFATLSISDLNYEHVEVWLDGMMLFDMYLYPRQTPSASRREMGHLDTDPTFNLFGSNFPCGHFGNMKQTPYLVSSDSDIHECQLGKLSLPFIEASRFTSPHSPPVPEPHTYAMVLLGLAMMFLSQAKSTAPGRF